MEGRVGRERMEGGRDGARVGEDRERKEERWCKGGEDEEKERMSKYVQGQYLRVFLMVDVGRLKVIFVAHSNSLCHVLNYVYSILPHSCVCTHIPLVPLHLHMYIPHILTPTHIGMSCNIFP